MWKFMLSLLFCISMVQAKERILLVKNGIPQYVMQIDTQNREVLQAAAVINDFTERSTGARFNFQSSAHRQPKIILQQVPVSTVYPEDSYSLQFVKGDLCIKGSGRGIIYGAYRYVREIIGARKWYVGSENTSIPKLSSLEADVDLHIFAKPSFDYRELYFPIELDQEYMDWYGLHNLEERWGDWGHTFNKILPPAIYFKEHPEYYALYHGRRQPMQLCLSNEAVFEHTVAYLKKRMLENPTATYWSIAPNDDIGSCTCDRCQAVDKAEGGPQGSLIHFVNKVAAKFPDKKITTLAYMQTANAPLHLHAADNVIVMLSNIDAFRKYDIASEPSAATFRRQLQAWRARSQHVFVWDYLTQFTNYLAPFPVQGTLQKNLEYLKGNGVEGLFLQGGGSTYSDMAELNSYVLTHLLWDSNASEEKLVDEFVHGYYGKAGSLVKDYLIERRKALPPPSSALSIYGNPIDNRKDFLSPSAMDRYSTILEKAEILAEGNSQLAQRIRRIGLGLDYAYLQQAKFYGPHKHGIFEKVDGQWSVRPSVKRKVQQFVEDTKRMGILELAEGGPSPDQYEREWEDIFRAGVRINKASGARVSIKQPFDTSFPANGAQTLTDCVPGYLDYSYNWLLWTGTSFDVSIDLIKKQHIDTIELNFLQDARHWIFAPKQVRIRISEDGKNYKEVLAYHGESLDEDYNVQKLRFSAPVGSPVMNIQIVAEPFPELPEWRYHPTRKLSIACDEIWLD